MLILSLATKNYFRFLPYFPLCCFTVLLHSSASPSFGDSASFKNVLSCWIRHWLKNYLSIYGQQHGKLASFLGTVGLEKKKRLYEVQQVRHWSSSCCRCFWLSVTIIKWEGGCCTLWSGLNHLSTLDFNIIGLCCWRVTCIRHQKLLLHDSEKVCRNVAF